MELFETPQKDQMSRGQIEILDRKKHELKLVERQRKVPGHTLFCINLRTGEIRKAPVDHSKVYDVRTNGPLTSDRIVVEPDCLYRQALNKKNFVKRLVREGVIIRHVTD